MLKYDKWSLPSIVTDHFVVVFHSSSLSRSLSLRIIQLNRQGPVQKGNFPLILLLFASRSSRIRFQTLRRHSNNPQYLHHTIGIKQKANEPRHLMNSFWNFSLNSRSSRLQVFERTFWLNCDLFTLFCAVWIIAYRAHIAPSTILFEGDWLINDRFVMLSAPPRNISI